MYCPSFQSHNFALGSQERWDGAPDPDGPGATSRTQFDNNREQNYQPNRLLPVLCWGSLRTARGAGPLFTCCPNPPQAGPISLHVQVISKPQEHVVKVFCDTRRTRAKSQRRVVRPNRSTTTRQSKPCWILFRRGGGKQWELQKMLLLLQFSTPRRQRIWDPSCVRWDAMEDLWYCTAGIVWTRQRNSQPTP